MKVRAVVLAVGGEKFFGGWKDNTEEEIKVLTEFLKLIGEMTYLTLDLENGEKLYFNPANVLAVKLEQSND